MAIASNMTVLINTRKALRNAFSRQGFNASDHGYAMFADDLGEITDSIQAIIGDTGGTAVTINEKLNYLIEISNTVLFGEAQPSDPGAATTVSEAVLLLIEEINNLRNP